MSIRAGEQDIIPFSRLLKDKRAWDEALTEMASRTLGSPFSMVTNFFSGGSKIAKGNYLEGLKEAVPIALKGPIEAYRMTEAGYTDRQGNIIPMSVGANDILAQALGFSPSEKAEFSEARFAQIQRRAQIQRDASNIRKNLSIAIERNNREHARKWLRKARAFDRKNPGFAVLPGLSRTLLNRQKAMRMPVPGMRSLRDVSAIDLTQFANFELQ